MKLFTLQFKISFKMHYCQRCGKTFSRKFTLERHIEQIHGKVESRKRKLVQSESDTDTEELNSNNDSSSEKEQEDPQVLSPACIKMFQKIVFNGELGNVKVTKHTLVDLIENLNCEQDSDEDIDSNDNEEDTDNEDDENDEINEPLNDLQLQLLRVMLKAAEKRVFNLRKDNFLALINCFVVKMCV